MNDKDKLKKRDKRIKVLDEERRRDRTRLLKIKEFQQKQNNILEQIK